MKKVLSGSISTIMACCLVYAAATSIAGNWKITLQSPRGERTHDMKVVQDNDKLQVTMQSPRGEQVYQGTIQGADITWSGTRQTPDGREFTVTYSGKVEGDTMKGTVQMGDRGSFDWSVARAQ
ncbi:MAG: hypothetical protein JXI33_06370 [Candidatus Aminicenantes bacterium]|nr:hypothetical protein [Candidatus Aminicenantes bacterium]